MTVGIRLHHKRSVLGMTRLLVWLTILPLSQASTVKNYKLEDLVSHSSHIIVGRCVSTNSSWNAKGTLILTYSRFTVDQSLKGNATSQITVVTVGGRVGDHTQAVSGMPHFSPGQEALLFLEPGRAGNHQVVGMIQGHFAIVKNSQTGEREAVRSLAGLNLMDSKGITHSKEVLPARLPLDALVARIRALVTHPSTP